MDPKNSNSKLQFFLEILLLHILVLERLMYINV